MGKGAPVRLTEDDNVTLQIHDPKGNLAKPEVHEGIRISTAVRRPLRIADTHLVRIGQNIQLLFFMNKGQMAKTAQLDQFNLYKVIVSFKIDRGQLKKHFHMHILQWHNPCHRLLHKSQYRARSRVVHARWAPSTIPVILSTSEHTTSALACFTRNAFKAAPIIVSHEILKRNGGYVSAVVVNSGCADAVTGKQGLDNAWATIVETDKLLPTATTAAVKELAHETLVMSTGVISQHLAIAKIVEGIRSVPKVLGADLTAWEHVPQTFMTTDTLPKLHLHTFTIGGMEYWKNLAQDGE